MADRDLSPLTDDEKRALVALLKRTIDADGYSLSPRIGQLRGILAKLEPPETEAGAPAAAAAIRAAAGQDGAAVGRGYLAVVKSEVPQ